MLDNMGKQRVTHVNQVFSAVISSRDHPVSKIILHN